MKKVSRRAAFALILTIALVVGLLAFCVKYATDAQDWATFPGSPHAYNGSNLKGGRIFDRTGTLLLDTTNERVYASDETVRRATMHLLGDRYGYIPAPLLTSYADRMIGYDKIGGIQTEDVQVNARITISATVQAAALQALGDLHGTIGVYNYKTGEILCAVTSPSYDPDNMPDVEGDTTGAYDGVYVNRFFDSAYTPGSTFKLVTAAAALEADASHLNDAFTCEGTTILGGQEIICMGEHGELTMGDALAHSCNVWFGSLAAELGADVLQKTCDQVGLNGTLKVDGYTCKSTVDLSSADTGDTAWAGIGQYTDSVSACQFMRYMGILAGGGEAAEPYLMEKVVRGDDTAYTHEYKTTGRVLSAETCETMHTLMRQNVQTIYGDWQFGTLSVCAKSGTAERSDRQTDAMFAGFVQDEAYPLAFVVFVEEGGSGSQTAAPIAAKVLLACQQMLDTPNANDTPNY